MNSAVTEQSNRLAAYKDQLEKRYQSVYDQIVGNIESQKAAVMKEKSEKEEIKEEIRRLKMNLEQWKRSR